MGKGRKGRKQAGEGGRERDTQRKGRKSIPRQSMIISRLQRDGADEGMKGYEGRKEGRNWDWKRKGR